MTIIAVLLGLGGLLGLNETLVGWDTRPALKSGWGLLVSFISLSCAYGCWRIEPWARWTTMAISGAAMALWLVFWIGHPDLRLTEDQSWAPALGRVVGMIRNAAIVGYLLRPTVAASFRPTEFHQRRPR